MPFCTKCGKSLGEDEVCECLGSIKTDGAPTEQLEIPTTPQGTTVLQQVMQQVLQQDMTVQPKVTSEEPQILSNESKVTKVEPDPKVPEVKKPYEFLTILKELWEVIIGIIKTPVVSIKLYVEKSDIKSSCILIGTHAIVAALITLFELIKANSNIKMPIGYGEYDLKSIEKLQGLLNEMYNTGSAFPSKYTVTDMLVQMCRSALFVIGATAVVAFVIMLVSKMINQSKTTYIQGIAIASLAAIMTIPTIIIVFIFGLFGEEFFILIGSFVTSFSTAISAIYLFFGIRTICNNEDKLPLIAGLAAIGSTFAVYIIGLII